MSLPFSNAPVERLFSALKIVKSDCKNTLKRESLVGLLHTQQWMKSYNLPAEKLNVADHPELLKLVRKVKSNATDSEAQQCIANSVCGSFSFDWSNSFHAACILIKMKVLFIRFVFPTDLGIFRDLLVLFWGFLELHLGEPCSHFSDPVEAMKCWTGKVQYVLTACFAVD